MSAPCRGSKAPWNKQPRPRPIYDKAYQVTYDVPASVAVTRAAATKKSLAADGWVQYARPLEKPRPRRSSRGDSKD